MRAIHKVLITCISVNGSHKAFFNANLFIEGIGNRSKAICRTRRIRDNLVLFLDLVVINAINNCDVFIITRRRDEHFFRAHRHMLTCTFAVLKLAGAFHHDVDTFIPPRASFRLTRTKTCDLFAINDDLVFAALFNSERRAAMNGVILQKRKEVTARIVDRNNLDIITSAFKDRPRCKTANPPKSINTDT